jgi:hypothetical protein
MISVGMVDVLVLKSMNTSSKESISLHIHEAVVIIWDFLRGKLFARLQVHRAIDM